MCDRRCTRATAGPGAMGGRYLSQLESPLQPKARGRSETLVSVRVPGWLQHWHLAWRTTPATNDQSTNRCCLASYVLSRIPHADAGSGVSPGMRPCTWGTTGRWPRAHRDSRSSLDVHRHQLEAHSHPQMLAQSLLCASSATISLARLVSRAIEMARRRLRMETGRTESPMTRTYRHVFFSL
jgi:hypothetical protein